MTQGYDHRWLCPINQAHCGHGCVIRRACVSDPDRVRALLERVDRELVEAMVQLVRKRR